MRGSSKRHSPRGFTLIELALVLLIIGILAALAAPSLSVLGAARIDSEARRLAAVISYLHDEAALRGRVYKLTFDMEHGGYGVEVADDAGEFVSPSSAAGWDPYAPESRTFAEGVRIATLETASGSTSSGSASLFFLPEDAREDFRVVLENDAGAERWLEADGVTGRVAISTEAVAASLGSTHTIAPAKRDTHSPMSMDSAPSRRGERAHGMRAR